MTMAMCHVQLNSMEVECHVDADTGRSHQFFSTRQWHIVCFAKQAQLSYTCFNQQPAYLQNSSGKLMPITMGLRASQHALPLVRILLPHGCQVQYQT